MGQVISKKKNVTHSANEIPFVLEECAVVAFLCDALWASQIQINGIAMGFHHFGHFQQRFRIIGAKLFNDGKVIEILPIEIDILFLPGR